MVVFINKGDQTQRIKTVFLATFLLLLGGCNIYFDYVKRGYATDATTQIKSIYEASKLYRSENGDYPVDIADIADNNYFNIPRSTLDKWDFEINITDDDSGQMEGTIIATSLDEMPGGAGQFIEFDVSSGRYTGYGQKK